MSGIKAMKLWQKLLVGAVAMAVAGVLVFWLFASVLAPHLVQITLEVDPTNVTTKSVEAMLAVKPDLAKGFEPQMKQVRVMNSATGKTADEIYFALYGEYSIVCGNCGYSLSAEAGVKKDQTCPNCQAVHSPKLRHQAYIDAIKAKAGGPLDVLLTIGEGGFTCKTIQPCGHVFSAEEMADLSKGLKCPDCSMVYLPSGSTEAAQKAARKDLKLEADGSFICDARTNTKNACGYVFPAGTVVDPDHLPVCPQCDHQFTRADLGGMIKAAAVTVTAEKPILINYTMEYGSEKGAYEKAAANLKLIVTEVSAQIAKKSAGDYKAIEHGENIVHPAKNVLNTGVRTIIATIAAVILAGMVAYVVLSKAPFSLAFRRLLAYTVLVLLSILCIIFFYILFINATRAHADIQSRFTLLPGANVVGNWKSLMSNSELPVWRGMFNSLVVAGSVAVLSTYFSVLTAYAIHAYQFRLRNFAFKFILLVMMVPSQVSALGFVEMMTNWFHLDNTFWPLIIPSIAAPTVFFFMKQYMDSALPLAIVEAARIDGSSEFGTFNRIVIHIMKPAIAVQAIFTFVGSWNNYFTPALLLNKKNMKTLPILIAQLRSADWLKFDMGQVYMMICLSILPVIVVYLCLSKFIIAGVAVGGVKE